MKTFTNLYADLLEAHQLQLICLKERTETTNNEFWITFTQKVSTVARDKLYNHIREQYNVLVWWLSPDILCVQETSREREIRVPKQL